MILAKTKRPVSPVTAFNSSPRSVKVVGFDRWPTSPHLQVTPDCQLPIKKHHNGAGGLTQSPHMLPDRRAMRTLWTVARNASVMLTSREVAF